MTLNLETLGVSSYSECAWKHVRSFQVTGPRGVTASTLDSESSDRGSNPREALYIRILSEVLSHHRDVSFRMSHFKQRPTRMLRGH